MRELCDRGAVFNSICYPITAIGSQLTSVVRLARQQTRAVLIRYKLSWHCARDQFPNWTRWQTYLSISTSDQT